MYLKRDGTRIEHLPALDDYAKDDPNMGVETAYFVELFDSAASKTGTPTRTRASGGSTC